MAATPRKKAEAAVAAILIALAALYLGVQYAVNGPGWDLIAHYLNGRSLSNPAFYQCLLNVQCNLYNQNPLFYFEAYRAPLAAFIIAFVNLFANVSGNATIAIYMTVLVGLYVLAIGFLAERTKMNELLLLTMMLSPFVLMISIIPSSEEMASLIFLLVAIGFLAKRSPWFGLFLGLATLGKYPTLILIPMLLLLLKPRKILYASLLFLAAVVPWLAFNQVFFQNGPFTSYLLSLSISHDNSGPLFFSIPAYLTILSYPIAFALVGLGLVEVHHKLKNSFKDAKKMMKRAFSMKTIANDDEAYLHLIVMVLLVLSLVATLYIGPYYDQFTQERYGYLLGTAAALFIAVRLNDVKKYVGTGLPLAVAVISIVFFTYAILNSVYMQSPQIGAHSAVFKNAAAELSTFGYGNCKITTNDWIFMLYSNVPAFSQFNTNATSAQYPILYFRNQTSLTNITKLENILKNTTTVYSSRNFSILLPQNYRCYTRP